MGDGEWDIDEEALSHHRQFLYVKQHGIPQLLTDYRHRTQVDQDPQVQERLQEILDTYAEEAADIAEQYADYDRVTVEPHHEDYQWQRAVTEAVAEIDQHAYYLQQVATRFPNIGSDPETQLQHE